MDANDLSSLYLLAKTNRAKLLAVSINGSKLYHMEQAPQLAESILYLADKTDIPVSSLLSPDFCANKHVDLDWDILVRDVKKYNLPESPVKPLPISGPKLIHNAIERSNSKVTLLCSGPLNNVAHIISEYPEAIDKIERIVLLSGSLHTTESITIPFDNRWKKTANYNISVDPCAANIVFTSGIPITLIPLDVSNLLPINRLIIQKYAQKPTTPGAQFVMDVIKSAIKKHKEKTLTPFWVAIGVMAITHPQMIKTIKMSLRVITEDGPNFGELIESNEGNVVEVCTFIQQDKFYRTLFNMINH